MRYLSSVTATVGEPVRLDSQVTGKPEPKATWFKDRVELSDDRYQSVYKFFV